MPFCATFSKSIIKKLENTEKMKKRLSVRNEEHRIKEEERERKRERKIKIKK